MYLHPQKAITLRQPSPSPQITIQLGLDWTPIATVALLGVIDVLLVFVVVFLRKRSRKISA